MITGRGPPKAEGMKITGIIWLDSVVEKIDAKHGVACEEVGQVLPNPATRFRLVEEGLSETIRRTAKERGISPHTLVNLWPQEKVQTLKTGADHEALLVEYARHHTRDADVPQAVTPASCGRAGSPCREASVPTCR